MIDIRGVDELKAAALLFRNADKPIRAGIAKEARTWAPVLQRAVASRARDTVDRQIAASGRVAATTNGIKAVFGSTGRLSSGEPLRSVTRAWEFGTGRPDAYQEYLSRSPKGRAVRVTRRTQKQVPRINPRGRMIYAALPDVVPELVSRWVRVCARAVTP